MKRIKTILHDVIKVVSPMYDGEEKKDQDRAVWYPTARTACICDGVTSSPYSGEAAKLACMLSLAIFTDDPTSSLRVISDLLFAYRNEKMSSDIHLPLDASETMQSLIQEAARQNLAYSFQTTLVAAHLTHENKVVMCSVVRCGDSVFLAFDSKGQLLASSPSEFEKPNNSSKRVGGDKLSPLLSHHIQFGPGDEVLAKIRCDAHHFPYLTGKYGIDSKHLGSWLICEVLDKCVVKSNRDITAEKYAAPLKRGDLLIVPRYLAGSAVTIKSTSYIRILYSRTIRKLCGQPQNPHRIDFQKHSVTTAVLPDHFYTGNWTYFKDRFPLDAHFVLGSDGFYSCFKNPVDLWAWLNEHRNDLHQSQRRELLMDGLHCHLKQERSDDDISFVWICPKKVDLPYSATKETISKGD